MSSLVVNGVSLNLEFQPAERRGVRQPAVRHRNGGSAPAPQCSFDDGSSSRSELLTRLNSIPLRTCVSSAAEDRHCRHASTENFLSSISSSRGTFTEEVSREASFHPQSNEGVATSRCPCPAGQPSPPVVELQSDTVQPMSPAAVAARLNADPESILILDCRTFIAFNANHITGAVNIGCSDRITRKRLLSGRVTLVDLVSGVDAKEVYRRREASGAILVIYDDNSTKPATLPATHPLRLLIDFLRPKRGDVTYLDGK